ncbi:hypothetical protein [Stackebrandtia nassauensis]|uniref:Uncharacterized protein n=1 Tax=Stackebrandtia nassauensis (strain DSM 44728 / CIP 108903 / NRRL B-16338 / NBRC 102104 / LLR-40K-21) TaxID=446470 RepID=D3Q090_STANL|nr:hypothetical protein [Stackebrandtia nassauensis]ADD45619.1 hypothetical protein Snas_5993 [Stackebrandtia nassauensis DSM 44728]
MKFLVIQICGMVVLAIGGQGAIRLLIDHGDRGLLDWLPGGFAVTLAGYVLVAIIGLLLGGWGADKHKKQQQAERA